MPPEDLRLPIRVLVVEDEPRFRELLTSVLPDMGFPATPARSAEEALRIMEAAPHEIVLLDLNLPAMEGMEFFRILRQRWGQTQVIILTGFGDLAAAKEAIRLDVVDFLTKPSHLSDVETALARARGRIAAIRQAAVMAEPAEPPEPETDAKQRPVTLQEMERQCILEALRRNHGNRTATAAELGISRRMLHYRLSEYQQQGYPID